jgi:hypothetical protein
MLPFTFSWTPVWHAMPQPALGALYATIGTDYGIGMS